MLQSTEFEHVEDDDKFWFNGHAFYGVIHNLVSVRVIHVLVVFESECGCSFDRARSREYRIVYA